MATKKIFWGNWRKYWAQYENLEELNHAFDDLEHVFQEIEQHSGRILLSADMIGIQEALFERMETLAHPYQASQTGVYALAQ
ncbi:hypothetical protein L0128_19415 [candidate division KSB1 bacterium]|nr:hypothetical protein [candidate division KSB1 bacterium]